MPEYLYHCKCGNQAWVSHGMMEVINVSCECGATMKKKPIAHPINWGGFRYQASPAVARHLDDYERRKAEGLV